VRERPNKRMKLTAPGCYSERATERRSLSAVFDGLR
jgi:hypothetical protein